MRNKCKKIGFKKVFKTVYLHGFKVASTKLSINRNNLSIYLKKHHSQSYLSLINYLRKNKKNFTKNRYVINGDWVEIYMDNDICFVDKKDFEKVKLFTWHISSGGYPSANVNNKITTMHRFIIPNKNGFVIDHKNRNKMDNRRINLRYVTRSINNINKIQKNKSGHRGVIYCPNINKTNPWFSFIQKEKKRINIGYFKTKEEAIENRLKYEVKINGFIINSKQ